MKKEDLWNLDYTFAEYIYKGLKAFRKKNGSHPMGLTSELWDEILDTMVEGFRQYTLDDLELSKKENKERIKKFNKGMKLFNKYFHDLWI